MRRIFVLLCGVLLVGCGSNNLTEANNKNNIQQEAGKEETTQEVIEDNNDKVQESEKVDEEQEEIDMANQIHIETDGFVKNMDKIFEDLESYEGKTVTYEGLLVKADESNNQYAVVRNYDIDHGDHTHTIYVGLEVTSQEDMPEENSWVEVSGIIQRANSGEEEYPVLKIESITVLPEVGDVKVVD